MGTRFHRVIAEDVTALQFVDPVSMLEFIADDGELCGHCSSPAVIIHSPLLAVPIDAELVHDSTCPLSGSKVAQSQDDKEIHVYH